jgi:acetylornithine deacetylase
MNLSSAESRVLAAIDDEALVRDLVDLIRIPSVTGTAAESELQHLQASALRELGMEVDAWRIDVEAIRAHPDFPGDETERSEGYGVAATMAGEEGGEPAVVLQGHVDVVPIGDRQRWQHDPFGAWIDGDALHGRGACDMKAGVAVNLAVARALRASGVRLARPFAVHTVVSEEDGGLGAFATLQRGHRGEVAVITEPTSGTLITANAGALTFELRVPGRAAHGSTRLEGVSAFDAFLPVNAGIARLEAERNRDPDPLFHGNPLPYPISIGRIRAGDWASSVPDLLVAEGRLGVRLDEDPRDARAALERTVADTCAGDPWLRDHPVAVAWTGGQFASGRLRQDHALIDEVSDAVSTVTGAAPIPAAAPYGSDLRLYTGIGGIPTLHYGPGDVRFAHAPREQVGIAETLRVARVLALLAARRCGARLPR